MMRACAFVQRMDLFLAAHVNPFYGARRSGSFLGVPVVFYRVVLDGSAWFLFDVA
jgi:hypothetical protein